MASQGPVAAQILEENIEVMVELAQIYHIKTISCSITPMSDYTSHNQTIQRPPSQIVEPNTWIRNYAAEAKLPFCEYYSAIVDNAAMLKERCSDGGLHPNHRGYAPLASAAEQEIEKAMDEKR